MHIFSIFFKRCELAKWKLSVQYLDFHLEILRLHACMGLVVMHDWSCMTLLTSLFAVHYLTITSAEDITVGGYPFYTDVSGGPGQEVWLA